MAGLELIEMFGLHVEADEASRALDPQTWVMHYSANGRVLLGGRGWPQGVVPLHENQVDDLADRGWVRITEQRGNGRTYVVTADGRQAWARYVAQHRHDPQAVDLGWESVRETLRQIYELYEAQGAPAMGAWIRQLIDDAVAGHQAEAHVEALVRGGYLEVGNSSAAGTMSVHPTDRTLQLFAGWPSGTAQEALDGLLRDIDTAIERTPDEDRHSKLTTLRSGLMGAGRDVLLAYFEKKVIGL